MPLFYSAFGFSLAANRAVPGLTPRVLRSPVDTWIWLDAVPVLTPIRDFPDDPCYISDGRDGNAPALKVWRLADGAWFRLRYSDGTEFLVDQAGTEIWATWPDSSTLEDTATYLLGPVLGFVLRLRGVTCLHASAVAVGDRAVALLGPAEAGKSTTAAAFCRMGYPVLTDDVLALLERDGGMHVQPAYPQLRLWPEAVALLYGSADALPRLTPNWDKRGLTLSDSGCCFQHEPLPLSAIYVLAERSSGAEPRVERVRGREILLTLLANTYVGYLLDDGMRAQEFASLGRLASTVPVRRVVPPADPARITTLCTRVLEDFQTLRGKPNVEPPTTNAERRTSNVALQRRT